MAENENQSVVKKKLKGVGGVINEFKTFISRGNVLDMAVGVIVGGAFTSIVNSLVDDILMPFIGMILAGINFRSLGVTIPWGNRPYINIGNFLQAIITFILTAMCVFFIVKFKKFQKSVDKLFYLWYNLIVVEILAQLAEHTPFKRRVESSNLSYLTKRKC